MGMTTGIATSATDGVIEILGTAIGVVLAGGFYTVWRMHQFMSAVCHVTERVAARWRRSDFHGVYARV